MAVTTSELSTAAPSTGTQITPEMRLRAPARTGAEAIFQLLVACGVEYVFLNPGTDTAPIQEALVALAADGEAVPTLVPCLYENVAMAAAHGYFLVTRRPQLVVVHVDVGTQNLGGNGAARRGWWCWPGARRTPSTARCPAVGIVPSNGSRT